METPPLKTKKQIVLSQVIYDYVMNGIVDSLSSLSQEEKQLFMMRVNIQAITHAIDLSHQEQIEDLTYSFNQLGVSFETMVPLSKLELTDELIEQRINTLRQELGNEFNDMITYFQKMQSPIA